METNNLREFVKEICYLFMKYKEIDYCEPYIIEQVYKEIAKNPQRTAVNLKFRVGDLIMKPSDTSYKKLVLRLEDTYYACNGCTIDYKDQDLWRKVKSIDDIRENDLVRVADDPNAYNIEEIVDGYAHLKSVHGNKKHIMPKLEELLTNDGVNIMEYISKRS